VGVVLIRGDDEFCFLHDAGVLQSLDLFGFLDKSLNFLLSLFPYKFLTCVALLSSPEDSLRG
jgi:hypothetical protein